MTPPSPVLYRLNDRDEIVFVNAAWTRFAAENGGDRVAASGVIGRSLWEFVADPTTRHLYREVLARVRAGRAMRFTFRCDSPACRRLMEMEVARVPGGETEFRARTLSEETRPAQPLLETGGHRSGELVRMCSWCQRVEVRGVWLEVEEAAARLGLFELPVLPRLTHGICEPCYARMAEMLAE